jgi:hypothetical protein
MAFDMQKRLVELNVQWRSRGIEEPFRARMGINTGYVNVGNFGSDDRMDYTIIGAEANLASRLQSIAEPGGIVLSYETYSLVRQLVRARPLYPITLKGIARPVVPYAVDGRLDDAAGRSSEEPRFSARLRDACPNPHPRSRALSPSPGGTSSSTSGKSRWSFKLPSSTLFRAKARHNGSSSGSALDIHGLSTWNFSVMTNFYLELAGGFNWSAQHLLILLDEEVADGDVTDIIHGEAEGRTLGALEERTKCVGHLPGAGKEEQDRRSADRSSQWRDRSGAASQSCGGVEA